MSAKALKLLNQAIALLQMAGVNVKICRMYNAPGYDLFVALPAEIVMSGSELELVPPRGSEVQDDQVLHQVGVC